VQLGHLVAAEEEQEYPLGAQEGDPLRTGDIPNATPPLPWRLRFNWRGMVAILQRRVLEERPEINLRQFLPMESAVAAEYKCQGQQQYHGHYHGALQLEFWVLLT